MNRYAGHRTGGFVLHHEGARDPVACCVVVPHSIRDEADLAEVAGSGVFGTVTRAADDRGDLREELGATLFGAAAPAAPARRSA